MSTIKTAVSKILNFNNEPSKRTEGQFWYDTNNNVLKRSDGTTYTPISVGDNLISKGSTDTVKSVLNNKAEKSELSNYLKKSGDNYLELGNLNSSGSAVILGRNFAGEDEDFYGDRIELSGSGINVIVPDYGGTEIDGYKISINNPENEIGISSDSGFTGTYIDTNLATELEDGHIASSKAIKSYVDTSVLNKADKSDVVSLTGNQTISGSKIFNNITIDNLNGNTTDVDGVKISTNTNSIELYAAAYTDESNTPHNNIFTKIDAKKLEVSNSTPSGTESIQIDASNIKFTGEDIAFDINAYDGIHMYRGGGYSTDITSFSILSQNNYGVSITSGGNQYIISNIPSHDAVSQLMGHHNLLGGIENTFVGYSIGTGLDLESGDLSNFKNTSIFNVGYSIDYTTDEVTPEISGSLVDKLISSSSLDTHIPTSKAVYTSLANKQDKLTFVKEDASIGDLYLGDTGNAYITIAQDGGTMEINGTNLTISNTNSIILNSDSGFAGSAIVSTLGTSTTSSKLPTEGAIVKAINGVKNSMGSALTYEGSVTNYSNLPSNLTSADKGKVYNVVNANGNIPAGTNYAWNGTTWDALGGDMSAYLRKEGDTSVIIGSIADDDAEELTPYTKIEPGYLKIYHDDTDEGEFIVNGGSFWVGCTGGSETISFSYGTGLSGSVIDTSISSTPEDGHIVTTGAVKTYVDNSTSNKVEKNSDANLTSIVMPTFSSSTGAQNGLAKLKLYKDDTTGAITIEIEEVE